MWRKIFVLALLGFLLAPGAAMAQFQMGDMELTLNGNGSSDNDFDATVTSVELSLGYFMNANLEGIVRQGVSYIDVPGDNIWNGSTRLGLDYHFDLQMWQPFVGASIGMIYGDMVKDQFIAGPEVGIKAFVNTTTFILASVEYDVLFEDADEVDDQFSDGRYVYNLGVGFRW
ncbi:MAG: hypothetical protein CVU69_10240 [Deltaproteobacteria bacterium HGW-Deltaproteobacteria-4]|nr:MAG: hypothetical protein CVU69_10240 [Deltaproteobacteria bacterium HGW-Deltaproteobacteria-4]